MRRRSGLLIGLLTVAALAGVSTVASAMVPITLVVNGKPLSISPAPFLEGGRLMVPLRAVAQALGATVTWDGSSHTVSVNSSLTPYIVPQSVNTQKRAVTMAGDHGSTSVSIQINWARAYMVPPLPYPTTTAYKDVAVYLTLYNQGPHNVLINPLRDMALQDSQGTLYRLDFTANEQQSNSIAAWKYLQAGQTEAGELLFLAPQQANQLRFVWQPPGSAGISMALPGIQGLAGP